MTNGRRPDPGDKDRKKTSRVSRPNSSHSGYGEKYVIVTRVQENWKISSFWYHLFLLKLLSFSYEYIIKKEFSYPRGPQPRSLVLVTHQSALKLWFLVPDIKLQVWIYCVWGTLWDDREYICTLTACRKTESRFEMISFLKNISNSESSLFWVGKQHGTTKQQWWWQKHQLRNPHSVLGIELKLNMHYYM